MAEECQHESIRARVAGYLDSLHRSIISLAYKRTLCWAFAYTRLVCTHTYRAEWGIPVLYASEEPHCHDLCTSMYITQPGKQRLNPGLFLGIHDDGINIRLSNRSWRYQFVGQLRSITDVNHYGVAHSS